MDEVLRKRRILITCGTGGVGKTTVSAALALRAATQGRDAVVVTIDPAKRLATSLGLEYLGDEPTDLTPHIRRKIPGRLSALMPDTRQTFERFIHSLTNDPKLAERIFTNPIFQIFAKEFSGTNEYMALQRLHALNSSGDYDCIVLDTPPSRNTLAFLDAPQLLAQFFDERVIRWLVMPANRIMAGGMRKALEVLERLTGAGFMTHLLDFASALFEVRAAFTAKLEEVMRLLRSEDVGFILVGAPTPDTEPEISQFIRSLEEHRFRFDGIAINRTLGYLDTRAVDRASLDPETLHGIELVEALQKREANAISEILGEATGACLLGKLPELARDVHSVEDLFYVAMALDSNPPMGT